MDKIESPNSTQNKESPEQRELENPSSSEQSKHKTKPRISAKETKGPKRGELENHSNSEQRKYKTRPQIPAWNIKRIKSIFPIPVIVALITVIGVIWASDTTKELLFSHITPTPAFSPMPTISILNIQSLNKPVNREYAPQEVSVSVNVLNAKGYYLYLIVDDGKIKWIQYPLGLIGSDKYRAEGNCYLGDTNNPAPAIGKTFTIYAVISSNESYQEHDDFTGQSFLAMSNSISLIRRDLLTPTP
jgi:hypothetical protein